MGGQLWFVNVIRKSFVRKENMKLSEFDVEGLISYIIINGENISETKNHDRLSVHLFTPNRGVKGRYLVTEGQFTGVWFSDNRPRSSIYSFVPHPRNGEWWQGQFFLSHWSLYSLLMTLQSTAYTIYIQIYPSDHLQWKNNFTLAVFKWKCFF